MFPSDYEPGDFYYKAENGEYKKLSDIESITINLSEEDSAKLWAAFEGLEII